MNLCLPAKPVLAFSAISATIFKLSSILTNPLNIWLQGHIFLSVDEYTGSNELIFEYSLYLKTFSILSLSLTHEIFTDNDNINRTSFLVSTFTI